MAWSKGIFYVLLLVAPFFYYSSWQGIRLLSLPILLVVFATFLGAGIKLRKLPVVFGFLPMLFLLLFFAFGTGDYSVLLAAYVFFIFFAFPTTLSERFYLTINEVKAKKCYLVSALAIAVGIHFQFALYHLGIEFGRVLTFGGGRTAFSFVWTDFSFISLFFMSALPFIFLYKGAYRWVIAGLLLTGSLISTGRTGIAAALLVLLIYVLVETIKVALTWRLSWPMIGAIVATLLLPFALYGANAMLGTRRLTFSGSGRMEGYLTALNDYVNNSLVFGRYFDVATYTATVEVVPHNLLLYMLVFGGLAFLVLFGLWLLFVWWEFAKASDDLFYSMLVVLAGTMFIPSFFSMYFFAMLIAIVLVTNIKKEAFVRYKALPLQD